MREGFESANSIFAKSKDTICNISIIAFWLEKHNLYYFSPFAMS